jgi:hypothetical protein
MEMICWRMGCDGGAPGIHAVLKPIDHGGIPGRMEISSAWTGFYRDAPIICSVSKGEPKPASLGCASRS